MFQPQLDVVLDPFIGERNWRHDEHIDFARLEGFLCLILVVGEVPMLQGPGCTEGLKAHKFVALDPSASAISPSGLGRTT